MRDGLSTALEKLNKTATKANGVGGVQNLDKVASPAEGLKATVAKIKVGPPRVTVSKEVGNQAGQLQGALQKVTDLETLNEQQHKDKAKQLRQALEDTAHFAGGLAEALNLARSLVDDSGAIDKLIQVKAKANNKAGEIQTEGVSGLN